MSAQKEDDRIVTVKSAFNDGLRVDQLDQTASPWIRAGLDVLQQGRELTVEVLEQADKSQKHGNTTII
ncbi:MAG: hypothetical protein UT00_C0015G0015 [Parcubacteria group bacterium GW2011_GWA1_38_7]|nr:MAG: hypothetical protein UT00_C0015G0015 [Parcubacteria group bacterium GW2011_GWA1_38_7]